MRNHTNGNRVAEKARQVMRESRDLAEEKLSEAKSFIHRKPVLSAALGVGLGFLLASLFRPRN